MVGPILPYPNHASTDGIKDFPFGHDFDLLSKTLTAGDK